jgi:hypothetical protein
MGGGEHGSRGRFAQEREGSRRWQGAFRVTKDMVSSFLPYPLRCTRFPATARPRRRGSIKRGGGVLREGEGPRLSLVSPGLIRARAGVRKRERWVSGTVRASASAIASRPARRRGLDRHRTAARRHRVARLRKRRARVGEGGGASKKAHPSLARWPASPAAARR